MTKNTDETTCPLCETNNACGINSDKPCWCVSANIPAELLQQLPENKQGISCICQACINKFNLESQ